MYNYCKSNYSFMSEDGELWADIFGLFCSQLHTEGDWIYCFQRAQWHRTPRIVLVLSKGMSYSCECWNCGSTSFLSAGCPGEGGGCVWCVGDKDLFIYNQDHNSYTHMGSLFTPIRMFTFTYGHNFMICLVSLRLAWANCKDFRLFLWHDV